MNQIARERLAEIARGNSKTLPLRRYRGLRLCESEGCKQRFRSYRKTCPKCGHRHEPLPRMKCRLCDEELPTNRRAWCSDSCMDAYFLIISGSYVREKVRARDQGVCAECGLDCQDLERRLRKLPREAERAKVKMLHELGFNATLWGGTNSLWDADHILALDEGGSYGLENLQTLCVPCHKTKTAEQASRKAKQKKLLGRKYMKTAKQRRATIENAALRLLEGDDGDKATT